MNLAMPRRPIVKYVRASTPEPMRRHGVRPVVTRLSQIGGRSAISHEEKLAHDLADVDHHDLGMDLAILLRTVRVVLLRDGVRHGRESENDMPEFMGTEITDATGGAHR